ncbi:MAG: response regulator [Thermodesulfobacteriota bacterium]|jgi:two-component system response regulator (stage 0 sporulation protein F)
MAHVLFIDDDASIRFLVQEELALEGHRVRVADDGWGGLRAVEEACPDVVVVDIKMPGLGGLEVLRRLKASHPAVPVFLFTAYSDFREEALELGADGYFIKSPDMTRLKEAIRGSTTSLTPPPQSGSGP